MIALARRGVQGALETVVIDPRVEVRNVRECYVGVRSTLAKQIASPIPELLVSDSCIEELAAGANSDAVREHDLLVGSYTLSFDVVRNLANKRREDQEVKRV